MAVCGPWLGAVIPPPLGERLDLPDSAEVGRAAKLYDAADVLAATSIGGSMPS